MTKLGSPAVKNSSPGCLASAIFNPCNDRPHLSRAVIAYLQGKAVTSLPWPAMSLDLNLIKRVCLGHARPVEPPVQYLHQLEAALHREWRQLPQQHI